MSFSFLPRLITDKVTDISAEFLLSEDIRLLMLDFDNTIVPYTTDVPTQEMLDWLEKMKASQVQLCVVSNSHNQRVPKFCETYGLDCITHARKPFTDGIQRCLSRYHISAQNSALAGDQIYTDTLGANCASVKSILVSAIDNHNIWLKLRHVAEMPFILLGKNRRLQNEKS